MPVRRPGVVGRQDRHLALQGLDHRITQRIWLQQQVHRHGRNGARRAGIAYPALAQLTTELDSGDRPLRQRRILACGAQRQLGAKADTGKRRVGDHHRIKAPHMLVIVRMQVGDAKVVDAARQQNKMILRRQQQGQLAVT